MKSEDENVVKNLIGRDKNGIKKTRSQQIEQYFFSFLTERWPCRRQVNYKKEIHWGICRAQIILDWTSCNAKVSSNTEMKDKKRKQRLATGKMRQCIEYSFGYLKPVGTSAIDSYEGVYKNNSKRTRFFADWKAEGIVVSDRKSNVANSKHTTANTM